MAEDVTELFAVVVEGGDQDPILMEAEGRGTSYEAAHQHLQRLLSGGTYFRGCIVRLQFASGNRAVLHAMKAVQDGPPMPIHWPARPARNETDF